jgi:hypothetical protein
MGGYETLLEQHIAGDRGTDLVCFTDEPTATSRTWQIRHVPPAFPLDSNRSSRRPKMLPHLYLDGYDESLYIDNSTLLLVEPDALFDALLPTDASMAVLRHSFRDRLREEFTAVVDQRKDAAWQCEEQLSHYERTHPELLDRPPLWGGLLLRRHHEPAVQGAMQIWWEHVLRYSRRDQLSLPIALADAGLQPVVHDLDNHISPFHEWPRGAVQRDPHGGAPLPPGPTARIAELDRQIAELQQQVATLQGEAAALRAQTEVAEAAATSTRSERDELAQQVAELHASTSWRVTRPLRSTREHITAWRAGTRRAATRPDA